LVTSPRKPRRPGRGPDHNCRMIQDPTQHEMEGRPFARIDRLPPQMAALLIGALESMAAHPEIQRVRRVAWDALAPAPGHRLLDAGCGAGEAARALAGAGAEVVALDFSVATVAAAAERHDGSAVTYVTGDVAALEFPDAHFDSVRCERVLQHLDDPDLAVAELVRVTRPGGRVCLIDTDWESLAVDGLPEDLTTRVRTHITQRSMGHNTAMGRTLRRRLVRAGAHDVTATPVACLFTHPSEAGHVLPMFNPMVPGEAGIVPDDVRDAWFAAIDAAGERNEFLAVLTIWVVTGRAAWR
jgi:ubiquinone/menaquinone biosynthesis C-methylase UbiE